MARVDLQGVSKRLGRTDVVAGVDLTVEDGMFCVIVGPSGSGKSTLLRLIAGLDDVSAGEIRFDGVRVDGLVPARRGVAMVFQSYALFPHMTVRDNMAFGLRRTGTDRGTVAGRVAESARLLRIEALLDRRPAQLSGGQQQRVAIGRAIVRRARVYLFDEPLSNLDAALRVEMRQELRNLHRRLGATFVYVTHDQVEAMTLADRMVVLDHGRIAQAGAPLDVYRHPCSLFVAGFIGSPRINVLPVTVRGTSAEGTRVVLPGGAEITVPVRADAAAAGTSLRLGVRCEHVTLGGADLQGTVVAVERIGSASHVYVTADGDADVVVAVAPADCPAAAGDRAGLALSAAACHLFAADGRALPRVCGEGAP